jgi:hypothetical protein
MAMPETPWWLTLIASWLPFVAMLAIYLYFLRELRRIFSTKDGRTISDVVLELANEMKRSSNDPPR